MRTISPRQEHQNEQSHHQGGGDIRPISDASMSSSSPSPSSSSSYSTTSSTTSSSRPIIRTHTHLTYSRHHLIDVAMETIKISERGSYINPSGREVHVKEDLDRAVENSVHYCHDFDFRSALLEGCDATGGHRHDPSPQKQKQQQQQQQQQQQRSWRRMRPRGSSTDSRFAKTSFLVVSASWIESALELLRAQRSSSSDGTTMMGGGDSSYRVGVLNSGSGTTPGGRFLKGTVSQEDCLCRASLLYSCISQPRFQSEGRFYGKNRGLKYGTSNCVIFSPDVPVIREDTVEGESSLLQTPDFIKTIDLIRSCYFSTPRIDWRRPSLGKLLDNYEKVSFVTIPAPNAFTTSSMSGKEYNDVEGGENRGMASRNVSVVDLSSMCGVDAPSFFDEKLEEKRSALLSSLSDRIHRALSALALGGCTDLVLPAFGCGVHGNDPSMVAGVFREMLTDTSQFGGRFRTVVFAVPPCRKQNYQAFAAYFQKSDRPRPTILRTVTLG